MEYKPSEPDRAQADPALKHFAGLCAAVFALCAVVLAVNVQILSDTVAGPFGVLAILGAILYLFAAGLTAQKLLPLGTDRPCRRRMWRPAVLTIFCVFMAADSVEWFSALYISPESDGFTARSLRQLLAAALSPTPERIGFSDALMIGTARLVLAAGPLYGAGFMLYDKNRTMRLLRMVFSSFNIRAIDGFLALFALGVLLRIIGGAEGVMFAAAADVCAALWVLVCVLGPDGEPDVEKAAETPAAYEPEYNEGQD